MIVQNLAVQSGQFFVVILLASWRKQYALYLV